MNKKVTIFAAALIVVGTIGTISSSIAAVPFMTDYANQIIKEASEETIIYDKKVDIKTLNINTKQLNVEVKPSNSDKLIVSQCGKISNSDISLNTNENEFTINQNYKETNFTVQGFGDAIINELRVGANKIIIYVPNKVDVKVKTEAGSLILEDKNVLAENISFNTNYGSIILPKDIKYLKNLNISSLGNINLKLSEILGFEGVNISTDGSVYIDSMPDDIFIENIEKYIPKKFNIVSSRYGSDININTVAPIAENLMIDNKSGYVYMSLPIDYYNIKTKLVASEEISINEENDSEENTNKEPIKQFEGTFRDAKENEIQYNIDIKSSVINLKK